MIVFTWHMDYNDFYVKNGSDKPDIPGTSGQERIFCLVSVKYFYYSLVITMDFNFLICPKFRPNFKGDNNI